MVEILAEQPLGLDMHMPNMDALKNMMEYWNDNYLVFSSVM